MIGAGDDIDAGFRIRPARTGDVPALERLIENSARALSRGFYSDDETEAAIRHIFGVDSDLVGDGTYFLAEEADRFVGCGGWSRRKTLFGGDRFDGRAAGFLDPAHDAARIRAFFVAPGHARKGIASQLLERCETAAAAQGFARTMLMATLPGEPFYAAHNYVAEAAVMQACGTVDVRLVPMTKELLPK